MVISCGWGFASFSAPPCPIPRRELPHADPRGSTPAAHCARSKRKAMETEDAVQIQNAMYVRPSSESITAFSFPLRTADPDWFRSTARVLVVIPYTVLVYDYFLTIQLEVSGFWTTSFTWGSFFFYLNRYSSLLGTIPVVVQFWLTTTDPGKIPVPDDSFREIKHTRLMPVLRCHSLRMYHQYFALISQVLVACILIMRTYALYSKNKLVLGVMITITLSAFASAMTLLLTGNNESTLSPELQVYGCPFATAHAKYVPSLVSSWLIRLADSSRQEHTIHSGLAEAWAGMLVFDSMIFVLTLYKALSIETRRGDLLTVLVRDGTIYFGLILVANAINIGTYTVEFSMIGICIRCPDSLCTDGQPLHSRERHKRDEHNVLRDHP
ncbi:unnamed protein product [Mycena citricolor]|uniref:DUF6533 domain-containing protein n=1 Tax=Mycena citricolor TaxID=2018698 RepID=A0AAD2HND1_9AGAR|nr:unnamed protein product [Mycena citricolor]